MNTQGPNRTVVVVCCPSCGKSFFQPLSMAEAHGHTIVKKTVPPHDHNGRRCKGSRQLIKEKP